ncbi:DUF1444 family protein [Octadecabacter ascidiaceicola]|uniref:DUF1444 family protein n=1 Tax=Octadecabacter ascidiaceicola TaxID=1655543 RepID=A0A238JTY9_9RHOB|nr:DUF1444 family protein [Octadecabacter ascidiaceicola]SMX33657.1 hypothetical protein OCA8868_00995 [Octadecabacter ascidiaceicola]
MRAILLFLFIALSSTVRADIPKPETLDDTLEMMLERLLPTYPEARINRANRNIVLDPSGNVIFNPDNIHSVLRNLENGADREAELNAFIATMITANTDAGLEGALPLEILYPVVRHQSFVENDGSLGLYSEPFVGDMVRVYAIDYPDYVAYVTKDHFDDGLTVDTLHAVAARNLSRKIEGTEFQQHGDIILVVNDGFYESSLVVDNALWESFSEQLGDDIIMAVPARDLLMFTPASAGESVAFMNDYRDEIIADGAHPLSALSYIWNDGAWQVYDR